MSLDYNQEPERDLELIVRKQTPFNAEPRLPDLMRHYITPERYFFCRSHGPVPITLDDGHVISIQASLDGRCEASVELSVEMLKAKFEKAEVMMAMQCAGNRRDGLHRVKHTKGVIWGAGAIGNAVYAGCRLSDVLALIGVTTQMSGIQDLHVAFTSVEKCEEDSCYGSSIPLSKALDPFGDVLLAYEMNGKPLTRDHGYPLRVVVPGYIGARSVKYLRSIKVQPNESSSFFQQRDYKLLPEQVCQEQQAESYWNRLPAIGEYNVQSFVCDPTEGLHRGPAQEIVVQGYALSGGGRSIQRVDVSGDDGKTWTVASLYQPNKTVRTWQWCLWSARIWATPDIRIVCRAVDSAGNIQPEYPVWNYRGVMNNAWRTVDKSLPHL